MSKYYFIILFLLCQNFSNSQEKGIVLDSITKKPIEYANIWVENSNTGTSTDNEGKFEIPKLYLNKKIIFSAVGYERKTIYFDSIQKVIYLNPATYLLKEIVIEHKINKTIKKIGEIKKSKIRSYFGNSNTPWMIARYFPFKEEYKQTIFINSIKIVTKSKVENAKFNIRLYEGSETNEPQNYIHSKNIIGIAKKGKSYSEIDLSNLNISFPKNGLFVVIEWLPVLENATTLKIKMGNDDYIETYYEPMVGILESTSSNNDWICSKGKWERIRKIKRSKETGIYKYIPMEITLTD